jgi:hypothetical protein
VPASLPTTTAAQFAWAPIEAAGRCRTPRSVHGPRPTGRALDADCRTRADVLSLNIAERSNRAPTSAVHSGCCCFVECDSTRGASGNCHGPTSVSAKFRERWHSCVASSRRLLYLSVNPLAHAYAGSNPVPGIVRRLDERSRGTARHPSSPPTQPARREPRDRPGGLPRPAGSSPRRRRPGLPPPAQLVPRRAGCHLLRVLSQPWSGLKPDVYIRGLLIQSATSGCRHLDRYLRRVPES